MKKLIAIVMLALMLTAVAALPAGAADGATTAICPDWLITEIGCDNTANKNEEVLPYITNPRYTSNAEPYEFIELTNTSNKPLNIYDYALTQNTAQPTSPSFETLIYKVSPIIPGSGWVQWTWGDVDAYWDAGVAMPTNPDYEEGVIQPGETIVIWLYYCHDLQDQFEHFRSYWRVPEDTKIFLMDAHTGMDTTKTSKSGAGETVPLGGRAKVFNIPNSGYCSYSIMKWDDDAKAKFEKECWEDTGTGVYLAKEGLHYITCDFIISWAGMYRPAEIMDFVESSCQTFNYIYSPTSAFWEDANGKRAEYAFTASYMESTVGYLTDEQKESLPDPNAVIEIPDTTPAETTPVPEFPGVDTEPTETEPTATEPTETEPTEVEPTVTEPTVTEPVTDPVTEPGGCGNVVALGVLACLAPAAIVICKKRK